MIYYNPYFKELQDERIEIIEEKVIKNNCFIYAYLHPNTSIVCPLCNGSNIILYGKKQRKINCDIFAHYKSIFILSYHRYLCKNCNHIFNDTNNITNRKESISKNIKLQILEDLKEDLTFTYIANHNNVSINTVIELFEKYIHPVRKILPEVMCIDEFKNLKNSDGKYAFLMLDPLTHKVIDVLPDRRTERLERYFYSIPWEERKNVKYIISDMYYPYRSVIKKLFPNSTHIVDVFHYTRYVCDAFQSVRIRIQNKFPSNSKEYRILKNNWKLLSLNIKDLTNDKYYNAYQQKQTSQSEIINDCLSLSPELAGAYNLYQDFLISLNNVKFQDAENFINDWINSLTNCDIAEFYDIRNTFINWKDEIINSFIRFGERKLHNGYIEGINNHVKSIKKISYGYKNFTHFRNRIMYVINKDCTSKNYFLF